MPTAVKKKDPSKIRRELPKPTKAGLRVARDLMPIMETMQRRVMQINKTIKKLQKAYKTQIKAEISARKQGINPNELKAMQKRRAELRRQIQVLQRSRKALQNTIGTWEKMLKTLSA